LSEHKAARNDRQTTFDKLFFDKLWRKWFVEGKTFDKPGGLSKVSRTFDKLLHGAWRSSPEPCMQKYAFLNANLRGKSVTIHVLGTKRAIDASYQARDASQRSRKRRFCRWAAGNVRARHGTSAVLFVVPYA